jgi:micrococcal nuclease
MALGLLCSLLACPVAWADEAVATTAWVSWVMDGDTLLLVPQGQQEPVKVRIDGIDAPETCQPGGEASRDAMIRLALRKTVQVQELAGPYAKLQKRAQKDKRGLFAASDAAMAPPVFRKFHGTCHAPFN